MARCVILSACPVSPALAGLLREDDFIIACDAGYRNCAPLHCKPHVIVGDFDTAPCPQQEDDEIVVLPHVKDDTDTEYAAKLAVQKGFDEVLLLGGLGGRRLEHTLANLCTGLGLEKRGVRYTTWHGWELLEAFEKSLGAAEGRERVKVVERETMTSISRGEPHDGKLY